MWFATIDSDILSCTPFYSFWSQESVHDSTDSVLYVDCQGIVRVTHKYLCAKMRDCIADLSQVKFLVVSENVETWVLEGNTFISEILDYGNDWDMNTWQIYNRKPNNVKIQ